MLLHDALGTRARQTKLSALAFEARFLLIFFVMKAEALILIPLLTLLCAVRADWVIVQDVESGSPMTQITNRIAVKIKGSKTKIDGGPQQSVIVDTDSGDQIIVMHWQKKYIVQSASQRKESLELMKKMLATTGSNSEKPPELRATGNKQKINGYDTEQFVWEAATGKGSYWITKDFPTNYAAILSSIENSFSEARSLPKGMLPDTNGLPGMPIRTEIEQAIKAPPGLTPEQLRQTGLGQGQTVRTVTTLVSVKEETLNDSEFATPAGYTQLGAATSATGSTEGLREVLKAMQKQGLSEADRKKLEQVIKDGEAQQRKAGKDTGAPTPKQ